MSAANPDYARSGRRSSDMVAIDSGRLLRRLRPLLRRSYPGFGFAPLRKTQQTQERGTSGTRRRDGAAPKRPKPSPANAGPNGVEKHSEAVRDRRSGGQKI